MTVLYMPIDKDNFTSVEEKLLNFVSDSRKEKILQINQDSVKLLSLYAALLIRYGFSKYYGINQKLEFDKTDSGKPYITNLEGFDVNISHTKNMVMCGISNNGNIGVDVEHNRTVHKNVSKKVYNPEEIAYVDNTKENSGFFEIWTKKEAYTKYLGTGLRNNITDINMLSNIHKDKLLFWKDEPYYFSVYSDDINSNPIRVSVDDIISYFL